MSEVYFRSSRRRQIARRRALVIILAVLLLAAIIFCTVRFLVPMLSSAVQPEEPAEEPGTVTPLPPEEPREPEEPAYDYSRPVPLSQEVSRSYFDDAVFIGTSRTQGLIMYTGLSNCISFATKGLSLAGIFGTEVSTPDGLIYPIPEALRQVSCGKVYIMLGMNDMGWQDKNTFGEKYGEALDMIREAQPDAQIYVQSVLPLTLKKEQSHPDEFNMARVNHYNDQLKELCREKQVYYVDVASVMTDEAGYLPDEAANDGVHLTPQYCKKWLVYLQTHVVLPEGYNGEFDVPVSGSENVPAGHQPTSECTDVTDFT